MNVSVDGIDESGGATLLIGCRTFFSSLAKDFSPSPALCRNALRAIAWLSS
jgi:hypothetical protein